ncbi:hypothetical protein BDZ90DRAFT_116400 [Jaminaea rosea]|uniref:Uncharacterized protein n=1 Tax=Jaminaea rosea TaxID=1569628 RepID=A0A316UWN3_9BASI|nr:hypothetical protein BDZ90DRAFT_116400 [Jaminaea rosea]PWN29642.1 hypothetical protein BDZ90DRAFT_116400 [Jaminaea rosea]
MSETYRSPDNSRKLDQSWILIDDDQQQIKAASTEHRHSLSSKDAYMAVSQPLDVAVCHKDVQRRANRHRSISSPVALVGLEPESRWSISTSSSDSKAKRSATQHSGTVGIDEPLQGDVASDAPSTAVLHCIALNDEPSSSTALSSSLASYVHLSVPPGRALQGSNPPSPTPVQTASPCTTPDQSISASSHSSHSLLPASISDESQPNPPRAEAARAQVQDRARRLKQSTSASYRQRMASGSSKASRGATASMKEMEEILSGPWMSDSSDEDDHRSRQLEASSSNCSHNNGNALPSAAKLKDRTFFMQGIAIGGSGALQKANKRPTNIAYLHRHHRWPSTSSSAGSNSLSASMSQASLSSSSQAAVGHRSHARNGSTSSSPLSPRAHSAGRTVSTERTWLPSSPSPSYSSSLTGAAALGSTLATSVIPVPGSTQLLRYREESCTASLSQPKSSLTSSRLQHASSHPTLSEAGGERAGVSIKEQAQAENGSEGGTHVLQSIAAGLSKRLRRWKRGNEGKEVRKGRLLAVKRTSTDGSRLRTAAPMIITESLTTVEDASPAASTTPTGPRLNSPPHRLFGPQPFSNRSMPTLSFMGTTSLDDVTPSPTVSSRADRPASPLGLTRDLQLEDRGAGFWRPRRPTLRRKEDHHLAC